MRKIVKDYLFNEALTTPEFAKVTGYLYPYIRKLIVERRLDCVKRGNTWFLDPQDYGITKKTIVDMRKRGEL